MSGERSNFPDQRWVLKRMWNTSRSAPFPSESLCLTAALISFYWLLIIRNRVEHSFSVCFLWCLSLTHSSHFHLFAGELLVTDLPCWILSGLWAMFPHKCRWQNHPAIGADSDINSWGWTQALFSSHHCIFKSKWFLFESSTSLQNCFCCLSLFSPVTETSSMSHGWPASILLLRAPNILYELVSYTRCSRWIKFDSNPWINREQ